MGIIVPEDQDHHYSKDQVRKENISNAKNPKREWEAKSSHLFLQNVWWVEMFRHSHFAHIFYVRKLLCIA